MSEAHDTANKEAAPDARKAKADKIKQAVVRGVPKAPAEVTPGARQQAIAWPELVPLGEHDRPQFPVDVFPPWLSEYIRAVAVSTQTPPDLASMLALSVLATASAKRARARVKPDYTEPLNLYTLTSLPPASRKSAVFGAMTAPLEAWVADQHERAAALVAQSEERLEILRARRKKLRLKALDDSLDEAERRQAEEEAVQLAVELAASTPQALPRLVADDATSEKLTSLLAVNGGRLALMSPEGNAFDVMSGRYSNGAVNIDVYLKAHCGDTMRVDRQGRPSEEIRDPALTVGLTVQPGVLSSLGSKPGFRDRGLLARFCYSLPQDRLGQRDVDPPPVPEAIKDEYAGKIKNLLGWLVRDASNAQDAVEAVGEAQAYCPPATPLLGLSDEARVRWLRFAAEVEQSLGPHGHLRQIADWAGKLPGAVARIAGLLHLADHADHASPWDIPISGDVLARAVRVGEYLIPHAKGAFEEINLDPACQAAEHILDWAVRKGRTDFSQREVFQALKGRYKRVKSLEPGLSVLCERGYLGVVQETETAVAGRPKGPLFVVNPAALALRSDQCPQKLTAAQTCEALEAAQEAKPDKRASRAGRKTVCV